MLSKTTLFGAIAALFLISCQQQIPENTTLTYNDSIYSLKQYKVERHPTVIRNGFGMDIYHDMNESNDTCYLKSANSTFAYDLLFYNEMAYFPLSTGDYSSSGCPVIFMYSDTVNTSNSVKAAMVGQGLHCFNTFTKDSITPAIISKLKSDPYINLSKYRTIIRTTTVNGSILLQTTADSLYSKLTIGSKFRPNVGGVFSIDDVSDEAQIDLQPVFLIKTREGLYAKFMVTRFKGVGNDTQKLSLQWQAIK
jgi:hypothetical protein